MKIPAALAACGLLACRGTVLGMATEEIGPKESCVAQPDWPKGIVEMARHPTRAYSIWINGGETFYFQAAPAEAHELVTLFCKARMRVHEIRIEEGPRTAKSFGGNEYEYDVSLQIVGGIARAVAGMREQEGTLEPVLTIFAKADSPLWKKLKLPGNAIVHCEVAGVEIKGQATRPARARWFGRVQAGSALGVEMGVSTRITLWDKNSPDGIQLATVGWDGLFQTVFSDGEIAGLKQGTSWLTVTIGNYATQAKKDDPKFPVTMLTRDKNQAQALTLEGPTYYWGRILFEDGSPAILNPAPWPGAEIWPDFPYAGMAHLDAEGYFKVCFTPEQIDTLKMLKARRNIYIPTEKQCSSTAIEIYPAELLSQDKAKAGVVKIAKPVFKPRYDPAMAPSLVGKPLPSLHAFKLASADTAISNRMVLLCFFDMQERPSRNCLSELAKAADELKRKGVFIVGIQVSPVGAPVLEDFARTNHVHFPLGMIGSEEAKTKFNWGLRSQPWLILADHAHIVRAEGFAAGEIYDKLDALR